MDPGELAALRGRVQFLEERLRYQEEAHREANRDAMYWKRLALTRGAELWRVRQQLGAAGKGS